MTVAVGCVTHYLTAVQLSVILITLLVAFAAVLLLGGVGVQLPIAHVPRASSTIVSLLNLVDIFV